MDDWDVGELCKNYNIQSLNMTQANVGWDQVDK
jgi:hypothetical protein